MSITDKGVIDFISKDYCNNTVLTISDDLNWDRGEEHLLLLRDKINSYLAAIESGN